VGNSSRQGGFSVISKNKRTSAAECTGCLGMKHGRRYIVTKSSHDGTFNAGDHIRQLSNGDILCIEAGGWIDSESVQNAAKGMDIELDSAYYEAKKNNLLQKLADLDD
jgi:hypothetical protein